MTPDADPRPLAATHSDGPAADGSESVRDVPGAQNGSQGVTQTILAGRADGVPGNCIQAAVATMLGLPIDAVPHFLLWDRWNHVLAEWLQERGYQLRCRFTHDVPEHRCIVAGMSPRGVSHVCVADGGRIVWDPHPSGGGLSKVDEAWTLLPIPRGSL